MKIIAPFLACGLLLVAACSVLETPKSPALARNLTNQAYDLLAQDQARAAAALFDQALASDAHDIRALQGKGIALNHLGNHAEAEALYAQGLQTSPDAVGLANNLAMSKILRGRYQDAINLLTPLAKDQKDNAIVQENLALATCLAGKKEAARTLYSKHLSPAETDDNLRFCEQYTTLRKR